jgi:predicted enzyme related to lactoylglutathione lyase
MEPKLVHIELPAQDTDRARTFWGRLAGWEFSGWEGGPEYWMFQGEPGGAIYPADGEVAGPIVYFGSADIDADIAAVRELGGQAEDKSPIPGVGWFARCHDTEGNRFSLFQMDESVPAG